MKTTTEERTSRARPWASRCRDIVVRGWQQGMAWLQHEVAESQKCEQCGNRVRLLSSICPHCSGSSPVKISPLACAAVLAAGALVVTLLLWLI